MTTTPRPKPELTPAQKAAQVRRIIAALEQRQKNERLARAVVAVLDRVRKPFQ
jgi:hypothetical protein